MKQRQTCSPQNATGTMDLEALDAWLEKLKPAAKVDGVSMLDGYLAAIIIGPCSISPDEWFFDLLGARGNIGTAQGKTLKAIMAVVERFNAISETLSTAPKNTRQFFIVLMMEPSLPDHGARGSLPPCNSDGPPGKNYVTWIASSTVCCSPFFCTALTNSVVHT